MKLTEKDALIIVDVQHDFLPGGALAVPEGDQIIAKINAIQEKFDFIVATQDFHPENHKSFAVNHPGKQIGETIDLNGLPQFLWPKHCVQGSEGAAFARDLDRKNWKEIFQKGLNPEVDSYSGFFDNARREDTGLSAYLKQNRIERVFICGLALDYCVKYTALDALSQDFTTYLITDATRAVNVKSTDGVKALEDLEESGVKLITSEDI